MFVSETDIVVLLLGTCKCERSLVLLLLIVGCKENPKTNDEAEKSESENPNIVFIYVDDMGYGDLSCYGQKTLKTPNIDKLASEGMLFTQHYAGSTVCAPSRAALLTGKHTGHTSVRGNSPEGQLIHDNEETIAEMLGKKGYNSAVIGKWVAEAWAIHREKLVRNTKVTASIIDRYKDEYTSDEIAEVVSEYNMGVIFFLLAGYQYAA